MKNNSANPEKFRNISEIPQIICFANLSATLCNTSWNSDKLSSNLTRKWQNWNFIENREISYQILLKIANILSNFHSPKFVDQVPSLMKITSWPRPWSGSPGCTATLFHFPSSCALSRRRCRTWPSSTSSAVEFGLTLSYDGFLSNSLTSKCSDFCLTRI